MQGRDGSGYSELRNTLVQVWIYPRLLPPSRGEFKSMFLPTPHTYSPFNHFLSIHTNLVEFRFCRLLLKEGFIAGRREQGEDAGR